MHARDMALALLFTALTVGCTRGDPASAPRPDDGPRAIEVAHQAAPGDPGTVTSPPHEPAYEENATVYNVSLSLVVDDPARALGQSEELLRKLGGEVTYASANGDNANLNGRIPVEARHQLRDALSKLGGTIQSENLSTSDVSYELKRLRKRMLALQVADAQVAAMVGGHDDAAQVEAAALLRELTDRERQSIEAQLQNYRTQTRDGQVNVSFTRPAPDVNH